MEAEDHGSPGRSPSRNESTLPADQIAANIKALEGELKQLQGRGPKRPMAMGLKEEADIVDLHVHIHDARQADVALKSGVTTVRSMGVANFADVGLRELQKSEAADLPEVFAAGYHVRPQLDPAAFLNDVSLAPLMRGVQGGAAFLQVVQFMVNRRVDWIKTTPTGRGGLPETARASRR